MISNHRIVELAIDIGFDACGVSVAEELIVEKEHFYNWISNGYHADMGYMSRNINLRLNPTLLVPNAKSVISVLLSYKKEDIPIVANSPKVSRYALSTDYHKVVKDMLFELLFRLRVEFGEINGRAFVDSAPVLERFWAVKAGLGWIGKSTNLINPKMGSYVFIGELIVDAEIEPTTSQIPDRCGSCTRCIDACPTGAIVTSRVLDANKCISYINIEKKSDLDDNDFSALNGWCFGCDICQEVCPWNVKSPTKNHSRLYDERLTVLLPDQLVNMDKKEFEELFVNTPLMRAGYGKVMQAVNGIVDGKSQSV